MDDRAEHQSSERRFTFSRDVLQEAKRARGRLLRDMVSALLKSIAASAESTVRNAPRAPRRGAKGTPGS